MSKHTQKHIQSYTCMYICIYTTYTFTYCICLRQQDYAAFVLGSLLLVTFYRVPTTLGAVFCGEREAGGPPGASRSPLVQRLRIVLNCQAWVRGAGNLFLVAGSFGVFF